MKRVLFFVNLALIGWCAWMVSSCDLIFHNDVTKPGQNDSIPTVPGDSTVIPSDTTVIPLDTTVIPIDTTVTPTPIDSVVFPPIPDEPIPSSFPRKQLIEEFTGQGCGYCPSGMNSIHEYIGNDPNWVLVLHHSYGYDNMTVDGSMTIADELGVSSAPNIDINRESYKGRNIIFHPAYISSVASGVPTTSKASVVIDPIYDAASRRLHVRVSGAVTDATINQLSLTVLIKESGIIDYQQDYYETYEGWSAFRHTNAARAFLTDPKGDKVTINAQRYQAIYSITMDNEWEPDNCMIVAYVSSDFMPVMQAEQRPVVDGTAGGADITHGGITKVPVADYYPESSATQGPADISGHAYETLTYAEAGYENVPSYGFNYWTIYAFDANGNVTVGGSRCLPFCRISLFTDLSQTSIPVGTYPFNTSLQPGTAYAGYRDDATYTVGGSDFLFTEKVYFDYGYLNEKARWMIADGNLTISENGWEVVGHALNGSAIHLVGTSAITNLGQMGSPKKAPQKAPKSDTNPKGMKSCRLK